LQALHYPLLRADGTAADTLELEEEIVASVAEIVRVLYQGDPAQQRSSPNTLRAHEGPAHGAINTFFVNRRQDRGLGSPWCYWLEWVVVVETPII
jgi:hypothetical protein